MNLVIVVAFCFLPDNLVRIPDIGDLFLHTDSHHSILQPLVWPLNLTFCLGRQGVNHLGSGAQNTLLPLGINAVGFNRLINPDAFTVGHVAEYPQLVGVPFQRNSVLKADIPGCFDV